MTTSVARATMLSMNATPQTTPPPQTPYEAVGRARKVLRLTMALDGALDMMGVDQFSLRALDVVDAMTPAAWEEASKRAGGGEPSQTTKDEVREVYRVRTETRAALSRLTAPLPRAAR